MLNNSCTLRPMAWAFAAALLMLVVPRVALAGSPGDPVRDATGQMLIRVRLPLIATSPAGYRCPTTSDRQYSLIDVGSAPSDRPAALHADLNLALRGYEPTQAFLGLVDYNGDTDGDPPQLPDLFEPRRVPAFAGAWQVYDWNWGCGSMGCRGALLQTPDVTMLGMVTTPGEPIRIPGRSASIAGGGYRALVLYAEERRITLKYTNEDNVVTGYTVHLEGVCVDANLLAAYRDANESGRSDLPALPNSKVLGTAGGDYISVAVRDNGTFMDPRSHKDWWQGVAYNGPVIRRSGTARGW